MTFSVKSGGLHRRAQLTRQIHDLEAEIILQTQEAGKLAYTLHGQLSACRQELDILRGLLVCSACGASNDPANLYCGTCGKALSQPGG